MFRAKFVLPPLFSLPVFLLAFSSQPPVQRTGAPAPPDNGQTCAGCHVGNAVNSALGSVTIEAGNYTPGQRLSIQVRIQHSAGRQRWGFEMTARRASDPSQVAGSFTAVAGQAVRCAGDGTPPCNGGVEYVSHNGAVTQPGTSFTYTVEWTAPAAAVGDVIFYAAANAANGNGSTDGDFIYTTSRTISPAVTTQRPSISNNGVITASDFGGVDRITPGTWIEIYGSNLSPTTREWAGSDFNGDLAPTSLDGVSVQINGRSAFVRFVSPTQVNVQVPNGIGIGTAIPVTVTNQAGTSTPVGVLGQEVAPGLLSPAAWRINNRQFVYAQSGAEVVGVTPGAISGVATRRARPGETIVMYGVGFGPADTLTNPIEQIAPGRIARGESRLLANPVIRFGSTQAQLSYAGLAPNFVGLYQFNVVVPLALAAGDYDLLVNVGDQQIGYRISVGQ